MKTVGFLLLSCLMAGAATSWATTITPIYGAGADDPTPVEPLPDNPGTTLGEQRRHAHAHLIKLAERIIWLPDSKPVPNLAEWVDSLDDGAESTVVTTLKRDETLGINYLQPHMLDVLSGAADSRKHFTRPGDHFHIRYSAKPASLSLVPTQSSQVVSGLHEIIHLLGLYSEDPTSAGDDQKLSLYDLNLRLAGSATRPWQMTQAQRNRLATAGDDARWLGSATTQAAAMQLLTTGQHSGQIFLDATAPGTLDSLSRTLSPASIMANQPAPTLELGIVAHILSDLGWGPVVDTAVRAAYAGDTLTADVSTDAHAENLSVTLKLPGNVKVSRIIASPASCFWSPTADIAGCGYASLNGVASIAYRLTGEPGIYQVGVDVDHQANHVDPKPANNFAVAQVTIGENTIAAVILSPSTVAGDAPVGTLVGALSATSTAPTALHTFALAPGGEDNAHFRIDGVHLLTAQEIAADRDQLSLRVLASASNGFTREQGFFVEVTREPESKACDWPNDAARGLLCIGGEDKPFLVNGTRRRDPARICTLGPGGARIDGGCHHLWYNQLGHPDLWRVPVQQAGFNNFLAELDRRAQKGERANYCLAEEPAPESVQIDKETSEVPGEHEYILTMRCQGNPKGCWAHEGCGGRALGQTWKEYGPIVPELPQPTKPQRKCPPPTEVVVDRFGNFLMCVDEWINEWPPLPLGA